MNIKTFIFTTIVALFTVHLSIAKHATVSGNDVSDKNIGFNSDFNSVSIFYKNKEKEIIPKMKKSIVAEEIIKRISQELN